MSVQSNKEIIRKVTAAFERNDPEVFLDYCTDDVKWIMAGDDARTGKQSIRDFMSNMGDFKLEKLTIDSIIAEDDSAACFGEMTVNEKGANVDYSYCDVYRFTGDKIVELRSFAVKHKTAGEADKAASA